MASAAACGESTPDLLASFDPTRSSWKTAQTCLLEGWEQFSETWPASGMMRSGTAFLLPRLVPDISETASGLSHFYPTPRANGGCNAGGSNSRKTARRNGTYISGSINPCHQELLMGFQTDHTALASSATQSFPSSRKSSGEQS